MTMENKPLLQVKDLTVTFGERHNKFTAVKNVSFDIFQGETFGLVGESGSGKTTIGRTVIRINPAASGEILYDGERISGRISGGGVTPAASSMASAAASPSAPAIRRSCACFWARKPPRMIPAALPSR